MYSIQTLKAIKIITANELNKKKHVFMACMDVSKAFLFCSSV